MLFGFRSEDAMRMAFKRGQLPKYCLVKIGTRRVRVDKQRLDGWLANRKGNDKTDFDLIP